MDNYLDAIMNNNMLEDSDDYINNNNDFVNIMNGGKSNVATGSFPPIYVLSGDQMKKRETVKYREIVTNDNKLSIKNILNSKKN